MGANLMRFIRTDVWRLRLNDLPPIKAAWVKYLRIFLAAAKRFGEHGCQLRASALTFFSLLSIVPVAAMAFGIAKGFYLDKKLEEQLLDQLPGQEEILLKVFDFANSMLEDTKGGLIAGVGVVVLLWTVIKLLGNIEESFNAIWGVRQTRTLARKVTDYLSIMLSAPLLLAVSSSATLFLTTQVEFVAGRLEFLGALRPAITSLLGLLPYLIMAFLFSFIYLFLPNTRTRTGSCVFAGVIAGTGYQILQWFYVKFQVGVAHQNAIYGSFAALPLFLAWLQLSWIIVLAGAEMASAHQNADMLEFEPDSRRVSMGLKKLLALRVVNLLCSRFLTDAGRLSMGGIATATDIPPVLLRQILGELEECGIVSTVAPQQGSEREYQPAIDTGVLTAAYVIEALEHRGTNDLPLARTHEWAALAESQQAFDRCIESSPANRLLRDI